MNDEKILEEEKIKNLAGVVLNYYVERWAGIHTVEHHIIPSLTENMIKLLDANMFLYSNKYIKPMTKESGADYPHITDEGEIFLGKYLDNTLEDKEEQAGHILDYYLTQATGIKLDRKAKQTTLSSEEVSVLKAQLFLEKKEYISFDGNNGYSSFRITNKGKPFFLIIITEKINIFKDILSRQKDCRCQQHVLLLF
ncbi:MAG: hypothetical protein ACP5N3_06340 [Candidatus Nanoarchaeia archaeon]